MRAYVVYRLTIFFIPEAKTTCAMAMGKTRSPITKAGRQMLLDAKSSEMSIEI